MRQASNPQAEQMGHASMVRTLVAAIRDPAGYFVWRLPVISGQVPARP